MKFTVKLTGLSSRHEENVEFGTCEWCMFTTDYEFPVMNFTAKREDGSIFEFEVEAGRWNWGDYDEYDFGNVVVFNDWLMKQSYAEEDFVIKIFDENNPKVSRTEFNKEKWLDNVHSVYQDYTIERG